MAIPHSEEHRREMSPITFCHRHINLFTEGLESMRDAVAHESESATEPAILHLWQHRLAGLEPSEENVRRDRPAADALLDGRLSLLNSEPFALGDPVDWTRFSESHPQLTSHLAYMYWLEPLGVAFRETGDERYAEKVLELIESFLTHLPYGSDKLPWYPVRPASGSELQTCNNGETSAVSGQWHSLACHSRIEAWLSSLALIRRSPALTFPRLSRILVSLMEEHARLIVGNPRENTPNQYISTSASLLKLAVAFPEFHTADAYFQIAWHRIVHALETIVLPDGAMLERSLNYNNALPGQLSRIAEILPPESASRRELLRSTARRVAMVLARLATPDGRQLPVAKTHPKSMLPLLQRWSTALSAPEFRQLANGTGPLTACTPSVHLPYGGYTILQSSWGRNATQLFFKSSGLSPGHMHEDCLHLGLFAEGHAILVEAGNFNYNDTTPLDRAMQVYCNSTQGHNGIQVDGLSQTRTRQRFSRTGRNMDQTPNWPYFRHRLPQRAMEGKWFSTVSGSYDDGFGDPKAPLFVHHSRRIVWIKDFGFLVIDRLQPSDDQEHEYGLSWHLDPRFQPHQVEWRSEVAALRTHAGTADLQLSMFSPHAITMERHHGSDVPCRGWQCLEYDQRTPKVDVLLKTKAHGPLTLVTLLRVPKINTEDPFVSTVGASENSVTFANSDGDSITCETGRDGFVKVQVRTAVLGERELQIPGDAQEPPAEAFQQEVRTLASLAVDENESLAAYFRP